MAAPDQPATEQQFVIAPPNAMAIVAAERLRQHEKIVRLRALREAAQTSQASDERKKTARSVRSWIPA